MKKMMISDVRSVLETAFNNALTDNDVVKALDSKGLKCPISISDLQAYDPEEQVEFICMCNNIG